MQYPQLAAAAFALLQTVPAQAQTDTGLFMNILPPGNLGYMNPID